LPEGVFLATPDELPGVVAQGRAVAEMLDSILTTYLSERSGQS